MLHYQDENCHEPALVNSDPVSWKTMPLLKRFPKSLSGEMDMLIIGNPRHSTSAKHDPVLVRVTANYAFRGNLFHSFRRMLEEPNEYSSLLYRSVESF
jgi:hypothetical protein